MITYSGPLVLGGRDDQIRAFIKWGELNGKLRLNDRAAALTSDLYGMYRQFCEVTAAEQMSVVSFGRTLVRLGSTPLRGTAGVRMHGGIQVMRY